MTNTIFFYNTVREQWSRSTSTASDQEVDQDTSQPHAVSLHSTITNACLACVRPPAELRDDDNDSTPGLVHQETGVHLEDPTFVSSHELLSAPPTPRTEHRLSQSFNLKYFRFMELKTTTRSFHSNAALGSGSLSMFKGWVDEHALTATRLGVGVAIAIKLLDNEIFQNLREWLENINYVGSLYHPNLVRLLGYSSEDNNHILVYEFMSRGSLEDFLFRTDAGARSFSWDLRMKVALGAAQGLAYLHNHGENKVHGNFKPSNILLDENYNAKLTDFGLRKPAPIYSIGVMETIYGDLGYGLDSGTIQCIHDAPEYYNGGDLTDKSVVYSFGVVLLEMLCGRRAFDYKSYNWTRLPAELNLVEWAKPFLHDGCRIHYILDRRLKGQCALPCARELAILARSCLSQYAEFRPNMNTVVKALQELKDWKK